MEAGEHFPEVVFDALSSREGGGASPNARDALTRLLHAIGQRASLKPIALSRLIRERSSGGTNTHNAIADVAIGHPGSVGVLVSRNTGSSDDGACGLSSAVSGDLRFYDTAVAHEVAHVLGQAVDRLRDEGCNERYLVMISDIVDVLHAPVCAPDGVLEGMYLIRRGHESPKRVQLLAAGSALAMAIQASDQLQSENDVAVDLWSVPSFTELVREAQGIHACGGHAQLTSGFSRRLLGTSGPVLAVTNGDRLIPEMLRAFCASDRRFLTLGSPSLALGDLPEPGVAGNTVNADCIVHAVLSGLQLKAPDQQELERQHRQLMSIACI